MSVCATAEMVANRVQRVNMYFNLYLIAIIFVYAHKDNYFFSTTYVTNRYRDVVV